MNPRFDRITLARLAVILAAGLIWVAVAHAHEGHDEQLMHVVGNVGALGGKSRVTSSLRLLSVEDRDGRARITYRTLYDPHTGGCNTSGKCGIVVAAEGATRPAVRYTGMNGFAPAVRSVRTRELRPGRYVVVTYIRTPLSVRDFGGNRIGEHVHLDIGSAPEPPVEPPQPPVQPEPPDPPVTPPPEPESPTDEPDAPVASSCTTFIPVMPSGSAVLRLVSYLDRDVTITVEARDAKGRPGLGTYRRTVPAYRSISVSTATLHRTFGRTRPWSLTVKGDVHALAIGTAAGVAVPWPAVRECTS